MRRIALIIFSLIFSLAINPFINYAQQDEQEQEHPETLLKLYLGEIKVLPVNNPKRIAIGKPSIVDVTNLTKTEMTLSPKSPGTSTLVFWDSLGEQSYKIKVYAEDIAAVKERIDNALANLKLPGVYTRADQEESRVILLGNVKNAQEREKISLVLGRLRDKTLDLMNVKEEETSVQIDVQVFEVDKDETKTLGLTNPLSSTITFTEVGTQALTGVTWPSAMFNVLQLKRGAFVWTLDALVQQGKARILSRPSLVCQSGKEAELSVGGQKPTFSTQVASAGGTGTTIEYKEFGIKLKIKPTAGEDNRIKVGLKVEVSEVGSPDSIGTTTTGLTTTTTTTAKAYPLSKRDISTELYLNDEQTLAIGGLIKQKEEEDVTKTPFLGDVPVLGALFRKRVSKIGGGSGERGNTELFITLTPKIIANAQSPAIKPAPEQKPQPKQEPLPMVKSEPIIPPVLNSLPSGLKDYVAVIQKRILDNIVYPASARQAKFQGRAKLSLHLSYTGDLLGVLVKDSSGYKVLDDNAVDAAKNLVPYPPFPASTDQKDIWIDIPIVYQLD